MKTDEQLYRYHVENQRMVARALDQTERDAKACIRLFDVDGLEVEVYVRLHTLLLAAWAECRLAKLLYESPGFSNAQRAVVMGGASHFERWQIAVEVAYRGKYGIPHADLTPQNLSHSAASRLVTLRELLDTDLRSIIETRNKLAHGQWRYPLNNAGNDVVTAQMGALNQENILRLHYKRRLLEHLAETIHDLVVSPVTFDRDFDLHYRGVQDTRRDLRGKDYAAYRHGLRARHKAARRLLTAPGRTGDAAREAVPETTDGEATPRPAEP